MVQKSLTTFLTRKGIWYLFQEKYYWSDKAISRQTRLFKVSLAVVFIQIRGLLYYKGKVSVLQWINPADRSEMRQKKNQPPD